MKIVEIPGNVLFPGAIIRAIGSGYNDKEKIFVVPTKNGQRIDSGMGVVARVILVRDQRYFEGLNRAKLREGANDKVESIKEPAADKTVVSQQLDLLKGSVKRLLDLSGTDGSKVVQEFTNSAAKVHTPSMLVDVLTSVMPFAFEQKCQLLQEVDLVKRIELAIRLVDKQAGVLEKAVTKVSTTKATKKQQKEDDEHDEMKELRDQLATLKLTQEGRKIVDREMKRLERMHPSQAEYNVTRTYLETICEIPWGSNEQFKRLTLDEVNRAKRVLDEEHYGLEKVKKRLIEYLTVMYLRQENGYITQQQQKNDKSSPILLLVGPPGVGKTSLAKSVATALNRKLHRISLGGLRDEAELKGHRRTYVGAMPGEFTKSLIKTGVSDPVIVLDEVDKLAGPTHYGDPTGVMLEVLDPESNGDYFDRYVSFPIDLSKVLFIATANSLDTISPPLLDRMEVINIEGYTYQEKEQIASRYLIPKQVRASGLSELKISPEVVRNIATNYTREAGVRSLEREIGKLCRGKAVQQLDFDTDWTSTVQNSDLEKLLGLPHFESQVVDDTVDDYEVDGKITKRVSAGVVNGLSYNGSGNGGILQFEATSMSPGTGKLQLTGKLGDVISESAKIAWSWVKANCDLLQIDGESLTKMDVHLHAPAGAVPKDGPSAGVAMTIALISMLTGRVIPSTLAMTGEMTLRGKVLPVGGIREKLLGAHLAGVTKVLVPFNCQKQVREDCSDLKDLEVVYIKYVWDALKHIGITEPDALSPQASHRTITHIPSQL